MVERTRKETIVGILSAVQEPVPLSLAAEFAGVTEAEVAEVASVPENGIVSVGGQYIANDQTRSAQGDLKWAHGMIADSIMKKFGFNL